MSSRLGKTGFPAEIVLDGGGAGDEDGGVSGTAGETLDLDFASGDAADGLDDLQHAEAFPVADVVDDFMFGFERSQGEQVGVGEIFNVNIVANAGAVGGGIVFAVDADGFAAAERGVEHERDEMRFGLVIFTVASDCARDVEVAKRGVAKAVCDTHPAHHIFTEQLAFAVGIGGRELRVLDDGGALGFAITGGSGGKDKAIVACDAHGVEQAEGATGVVAEIELGRLHGFAGLDQGGKMHDAIEAAFGEGGLKERTIEQVALNEAGAGGDCGLPAMAKVIVDANLVASREKETGNGTADVAGTAGDENFQGTLL